MRLPAIIALAGALAVPAAADETPEQLFRQFDLLGAWAVDCTAPAAPSNPHVDVTALGAGVVIERHDLGSGYEINRYSILSAKRLSSERLSMQVIFHAGDEIEERQRLVVRVRDGTRRTLFNQPDGGPVRVKDGVVQPSGVRTPLLKKCD